MMCSLPSRSAAWLLSTSFMSPMIETFCKGWTTNRAKVIPFESDSIAQLACEWRASRGNDLLRGSQLHR